MKRFSAFKRSMLCVVVLVSQNIYASSVDDEARKKVIAGLMLAESAKTTVEEAFRSGGLSGLSIAVSMWNNNFVNNGTSNYVSAMIIDEGSSATPGAITIVYDTSAAGIPELDIYSVMVLTPSIRFEGTSQALNSYTPATGRIEWACEGSYFMNAYRQQLPIKGGGTVMPMYSPAECQ